VRTAAHRAFARPGQSRPFLKNELTVEAGRRRHYQAPAMGFETFLQVLQVIDDVAF
jgi:hypothetical protein